MAVPLAVAPSPLAYDPSGAPASIIRPFPFPVGAEAALSFECGGPCDGALIEVDYYLSGGVDTIGAGRLPQPSRYEPSHLARTRGRQEDYFGGIEAQTTKDFFMGRDNRGGLLALFYWSDVSSYFWWYSPYAPWDGEVEPADDPEDFFAAGAPVEREDFFAELAVAPSGGTVWDTGLTIWDGGASLWD
jgi:hypothetical protein